MVSDRHDGPDTARYPPKEPDPESRPGPEGGWSAAQSGRDTLGQQGGRGAVLELVLTSSQRALAWRPTSAGSEVFP